MYINRTEVGPFIPEPDKIIARLGSSSLLDLYSLYRLIWRGSYPGIAGDEQFDWHIFYDSYLQTYLQRDIRDLARVGSEASFIRFLKATAFEVLKKFKMPIGPGGLICLVQDTIPLTEQHQAIPVSAL